MVVGWVEESRYDVSGRTLAVRQAGDPGGRPVVYFHGTPSCRLDAAFADDLCAELGVRMVSFDRPGYGESPAAPFSLSSIARDTAVARGHLARGAVRDPRSLGGRSVLPRLRGSPR